MTASRKRMQSLSSQMHHPQCQADPGILGRQSCGNPAGGTERLQLTWSPPGLRCTREKREESAGTKKEHSGRLWRM